MYDINKYIKQLEQLKVQEETKDNSGAVNGVLVNDDSAKFDPSSLISDKLNVPIGPSKKKLILSEIFEAGGGPEERLDGSFTYPYGLQDGKDPLRQALGKYWTPTQSGDDAYFLNPFIGDKTVSSFEAGAASIPVTIHFAAPELIEGEVWPEYEQKMYITPNLEWIYENFVKKYFSDQSEFIKEEIKKMMLDGTLTN